MAATAERPEGYEIIGVDHGYKNMKTRSHSFPTAIALLPDKPDDLCGIMRYKGQYYTEFGDSIASVENHVESNNDDYFLLTLIAIAKELTTRGKTNARIRLACGLPQKWYMTQKEDFKALLMREREVHYEYAGKKHWVTIENVSVYTQGYAAVLDRLGATRYKNSYFVIVDIGGETIDIVPVQNGRILQAECKIDTQATIWLYKKIQEQIETVLYNTVHDSVIKEYIETHDAQSATENPYEQLIQSELISYTAFVRRRLMEFRINLDLTPIIFVGGGAEIMYRYGSFNQQTTEYELDICANARGYELMERLMQRGQGR